MVTLIAIDNEQSLLLGEVHCRSQEKRGKKITLACRVGLWEKGKQIKVLLLCMSLQELCAMHQEIWFFNCTNDFSEKQGLPAVYYPKKWKETY